MTVIQPATRSSKCCPWATCFLPAGSALQSVGLALMVGGMLALGATTAPAVFGSLPRDQAAPLMAHIFIRYDLVLSLALGAVILGEMLRYLSREVSARSRLNWVRYALLILLSVGTYYSTDVLNPQIARLNQCGAHRDLQTKTGQQFDALHKRSEQVYKLDMMLALLLLVLTPFVRPTSKTESGHEAPSCCPTTVQEA